MVDNQLSTDRNWTTPRPGRQLSRSEAASTVVQLSEWDDNSDASGNGPVVSSVAARGSGALSATEILALGHVSKTFAGTRALDDVALDIHEGEVHCLVGHNGSGKSTLIKVLSGYHTPDPGAVCHFHGRPIEIGRLASGDGEGRLTFVHQNLGLVLELNVIDNLALRSGYAKRWGGAVDWRRAMSTAEALLEPFGVNLDFRRPLVEATPVERTIVAIAGALQGWDPARGVLVLDEPTSVLSRPEVNRLLEVLVEVCRQGASILYVSHRLDEVFEIGHRVTILRNGYKVDTINSGDISRQELVELMVGHPAHMHMTASGLRASTGSSDVTDEPPGASPVLEFSNLCGTYLRGVSFDLRAGEILGIVGLPEDGRDEMAAVLVNRDLAGVSGLVRRGGLSQEVELERWDRAELAVMPADRNTDGIVHRMTVKENLSLSVLHTLSNKRGLSRPRESIFADKWIATLKVATAGPDELIDNLSGGNQQKVVLGRILATEPKILVMCEPTAGVDISSREGIYELIGDATAAGLSGIVLSTDAEDYIGMCTRVLVVRHGEIAHSFVGQAINMRNVVSAMEGVEIDGE